MKDKIIAYVVLFLFFLITFLLMLVSDGVFGEEIKITLGWIILIFSVVLVLISLITKIYYKFKK